MDRFWEWVAYALPYRVVYWCLIRAGALASTGQWSYQEVTEMRHRDVIERWSKFYEPKRH
jgi:hypothetical protein